MQSDDRSVYGVTNLYGFAIGILMIEGYFPRPPGAIGNATTFPFPVLYRVVKGATGDRIVRQLPELDPKGADYKAAIAPWIEGAQALEREGVRAITSSCGFTALFHRELAEAVDIPVFATSLLLISLLSKMLKPSRRIGVITADSRVLTERHLQAAGVDPGTVAIAGLENCPLFEEMTYQNQHDIDLQRLEREVVGVATGLVEADRSVGAILLECSLLPPYAVAVQRATRLPVFDFTHLVTMVHDAVARRPFVGFL